LALLALLLLGLLRLVGGIGPNGKSDAVEKARRAEEIARISSGAAKPKNQTEERAVNPNKKEEV
jgi:hypothetical protein